MSNFNININYPTLSYLNKISYKIYERYNSLIDSEENIQLLNLDTNIYSILNSYSGDDKNKLVITNILSSNPNINLKYNNTVIDNINLPLEINISSLLDNDIIPNLIVDVNLPIDIQSGILEPNNFINISFYIKDINNQIGPTLKSSFQVKTKKRNSLSNITSILPIISNTIGEINYQITANNQPLNYSIDNLPAGINCNFLTGLINGSSLDINTHNIVINITNEKGINSINSTMQIINNNILIPEITSLLIVYLNITNSELTFKDRKSLFTYRIDATNNPTLYTFNLPFGLQGRENINNNIINLSLIDLPSGTYNIGLVASNSAGRDNKILSLIIS